MKVTSNGLVRLSNPVHGQGGDVTVLYVSGSLGSAQAYLVYIDEDGNEVPLEDGIIVIGNQYVIQMGLGVALFMRTSDADVSTNIILTMGGL